MANHLNFDKKVQIISMLCEGNSMRGISRMTDVHRDTINRLGVRVGKGCARIMDRLFRNLDCPLLEVDEAWGFIGAKAKTVKLKKLSAEYGDIWVWVAIDAATKLVPSFMVGDRDQYHANAFMDDLASRLITRPQISSDALAAYGGAIERAFGCDVDYASLIKVYAVKTVGEERRYSPPEIVSVKKARVAGAPDMDLVSTSYVEKQNHTLRMHCRRLSRLTNAFSKKRENFAAAVALHYGYYNLVKRHITIRCAPAVEAGVIDSALTVADLVEMIDAG
jgi:IS1 family transposase